MDESSDEEEESGPMIGGGKRHGDFGDRGGPPPPNPGAGNEAYRMNIQLQAEMEGLKEEMMRQQRHSVIAQEVQNRLLAQNQNPRTEIIRELQTIIQPTPPPPPAPAQHTDLVAMIEKAMSSNNHNLGRLAEQMGLSIQQLVEMFKDKKQSEVAASSSGQPPPPPPPPPAAAAQLYNISTPRSRSRATTPAPAATVAESSVAVVPARAPSREPSLASTTDYRSRSRSEKVKDAFEEEATHMQSQPLLPIREEGRGR
jgi:hypothetical protein